MSSLRYSFAKFICGFLPPIIAQQVRQFVYPRRVSIKEAFKYRVRSITGSFYSGNTNDFHAYPFSIHGFSEWRNVLIAKTLCSVGDVIVEVGANVGTESVCFSDIVGAQGMVYVFEPFPNNFNKLKIGTSEKKHDNIVYHDIALSDREGTLEFVIPSETSSGIGYISTDSNNPSLKKTKVEAKMLDSFTHTITNPRVIFLDTEGSEVAILKSGMEFIRTYKPFVVLEADNALLKRGGSSADELYRLMKHHGYEVYRIDKLGLFKLKSHKDFIVSSNWICFPPGTSKSIDNVRVNLLKGALLPPFKYLNPLKS